MKYKIKESQLKKIVFEEYNKLIKEGYVPSSAFNNFAKADESGILVANEKLSDFISYVENTPGVFENLPPMLKEMYQDAKNYFNAYPHLDKNQKPMEEGIVDKFTPYTPEEKARNFEYLRTGFGRTPEERNPSYAKAKKEAEERRRQRELQKKNESKRHINISKNDITEAIKQTLKEYETNNIN
jgi:hypothetical protein